MTVTPGLLNDVKNYLDMTWTLDPAETAKLTGLILRGMGYINRAAESDQDYTGETQAKALLLDYVRYGRSNALDEFEDNYLSQLLALQICPEVVADDPQP